jgi:hypothetical protein
MLRKQFAVRLAAKIGALVVVVVVVFMASPTFSQKLRPVRVGDLGIATGPVAHTPDELGALGVYDVFTLTEGDAPHDLLSVALNLEKVDTEGGKFTLLISANERSIRKSNKSAGETLQFYAGTKHDLYQIVIWKILDAHRVNGYIWVQKTNQQPSPPVKSPPTAGSPVSSVSTAQALNATEHFNRGAHFYNAKDDVHAAEEFQAALTADPGYSDAYYYLGAALIGRMTLDASGRVQAYPGTALAFQTYLALQPNGVHDADARRMLGVMSAPLSSPEAVARASHIHADAQKLLTMTGAPVSSRDAKNHEPAVPKSAANGVHWSTNPIPESVTVAFSFSKRCLRDECGDGAWGAAIDRDSNGAIQSAQDRCLSMTTRHGCNTGGRYFIQCKPGDGPKWVALAIYDDQVESLSDGEAMGYDTQAAAEQWAVSNCHRDGCHVVWSQAIKCGNDESASGSGSCTALVTASSSISMARIRWGLARSSSEPEAIELAKQQIAPNLQIVTGAWCNVAQCYVFQASDGERYANLNYHRCDLPHAAFAVVDGVEPAGDIYWWVIGEGATEVAAIQDATDKCARTNQHKTLPCRIERSW